MINNYLPTYIKREGKGQYFKVDMEGHVSKN